MERKKTKLTISGNPKKSFDNIEQAKLKNKNSVIIEKKPSKFKYSSSHKTVSQSTRFKDKKFSTIKPQITSKIASPIKDYEIWKDGEPVDPLLYFPELNQSNISVE